MRATPGGKSHADFALHVLCAWRIDGPAGILTGRFDLWEPPDGLDAGDLADWTYETSNLQDARLAVWLGEDRNSTRPPQPRPAVLAARATSCCGAEIDFSDGHRLTLFPCDSVGEDWRLFSPADDTGPHFVVSGGTIENAVRTQGS